MDTELRIGEVAKRSGVTIDALRYYEKLRLLPRTQRSAGGFRLFTVEHIERVQFIKQAQELGFSLEEIKSLLATGDADECRKVRDTASRKTLGTGWSAESNETFPWRPGATPFGLRRRTRTAR